MYDVVIALMLFVVMIPVMFLVAESYENKKDIEAQEREHERRQFLETYPSSSRQPEPNKTKREGDQKS